MRSSEQHHMHIQRSTKFISFISHQFSFLFSSLPSLRFVVFFFFIHFHSPFPFISTVCTPFASFCFILTLEFPLNVLHLVPCFFFFFFALRTLFTQQHRIYMNKIASIMYTVQCANANLRWEICLCVCGWYLLLFES